MIWFTWNKLSCLVLDNFFALPGIFWICLHYPVFILWKWYNWTDYEMSWNKMDYMYKNICRYLSIFGIRPFHSTPLRCCSKSAVDGSAPAKQPTSDILRSCVPVLAIKTMPGLPGWFVRYNLRHVSWFLWYKIQLTTAQDQPTINCQPSVLPAALLWVDSSLRIQWDLLLGDILDLASDLWHNHKTAQLLWELLRGLLASLNSNSHAVLIFDIS